MKARYIYIYIYIYIMFTVIRFVATYMLQEFLWVQLIEYPC